MTTAPKARTASETELVPLRCGIIKSFGAQNLWRLIGQNERMDHLKVLVVDALPEEGGQYVVGPETVGMKGQKDGVTKSIRSGRQWNQLAAVNSIQ